MALLEFKNLSKTYVKDRGQALNNVSFAIEPGKIVGLLGPNGSGKTTLLKLTCGLLVPTSGEVLFNGKAPGAESRAAIALLPDKSYLADWMRVEQILDFFADFFPDFDKARASQLLRELNIDPKQRFKTLSKGNQEKVQLIVVMSRRAQLYLLDEPIGGVDPAARDFIISTILTNYSENSTVMIATHLISDIETILDEVIVINQGNIALQDSVDGIRENRGQSVDQMFREVFSHVSQAA
ncbi:MAG: ABC transporter ATP-binding protein [Coriobacteriia bacterium]|nr:ABC transporter ATP-binding protein [Coriobacteriia bacterium]MCL2537026.1 ABC transporter ATP-binding protein [Coriobacteriia bacterium]